MNKIFIIALLILMPAAVQAKQKEVPVCAKDYKLAKETGMPRCGKGCWLETARKPLKQKDCGNAIKVRKSPGNPARVMIFSKGE